jgi:hypothetical protein
MGKSVLYNDPNIPNFRFRRIALEEMNHGAGKATRLTIPTAATIRMAP